MIEEPIVENFLGLGPLYFVNTLPTLAVTLVLLIWIAFATNRSIKKSAKSDLVPQGIGNLMEAIVEMLYNLTEGSAGKYARMIFPWFATIMIYVLLANLLKLIPGFESIGVLHPAHGEGHTIAELGGGWANLLPAKVEEGGYILAPFFRGISVDLNFTASLALIAVVMIQVIGFRAQGLGYLSKFFNTRRMFKVPFFGAMDFLVGLLELISELSKILSFAFRLFGNMFAGIVLVAIVAGLLGKISILPAMVMMFELFVGIIQAFVFGMLTMVFMAQATQGHGEHEEHEEAHTAAHEI
ncbi:MAG: F0F1 ATP synthase subunit A [Chloroflexi bacterium]|nr:F0F1 ATP synthase subunit A [Chloroflexota bacterium]